MDFRDYSLKELVSNVQGKKISAKELTQSALDNIDKFDFYYVFFEKFSIC